MLRKLTLLLFTAVSAFGQGRIRAIGPIPIPSGSTVAGVVTRVAGTQIELANGLLSIDVSQATITNDRGTSVPTITAGAMIFATLRTGLPLKASNVAVTSLPQVTLTGNVESVDALNKTLQILGVTIHVDANTSFGGNRNARGLADIVTGDFVQIGANATGSQLVASSIVVFAALPQVPTLIHGTVKSIGTDSWVITDSRRRDITVNINAQTRIIGSPKVGDAVDVLANVDSANNYVAISITPSLTTQMHITGVVKSISATQWVVGPAQGLGPDFLIQVNAQTMIIGDPRVGDRVDVLVAPSSNGFVAVSITKL